MIGGIVIETIVLPDKVWVNCVESKENCNDKCAIYVELNEKAKAIKPGDSLWWQSGNAMWTPYEQTAAANKTGQPGKCGVDFDIPIRKIGFSGCGRPKEVAA